MRVLAGLGLALSACFGPNVLDGSLKCEIGDECPPSMFCRLECGRRCFFNPSGTCGEDAPVPVGDAPITPVIDAPPGTPDVPVVPMPDVPVISVGDGPVIAMIDAPEPPMPDVPPPPTIDAPPLMVPDACVMIAATADAGIVICAPTMKPRR
ncbi:MAG TPA: hypothetical protein VKE22_09150 [Haliangiales bacterium]|nr:hypothetical protein [Haliangiales bacterium]